MSEAFWSTIPTLSYNYDTTMDVDELVAYNDKDVAGQINPNLETDGESSDHLSDDMEAIQLTDEQMAYYRLRQKAGLTDPAVDKRLGVELEEQNPENVFGEYVINIENGSTTFKPFKPLQ
jgi:hypothetical protein